MSGRAYPGSEVTVLKDGQVVTTTTADSKANFYIALTGLTPGNYFFSLYSEDAQGRRSSLVTFPVSVTNGVTSNITGIFLSPTIAVDKSEVKQGDTLKIFGQSVANSQITIEVNSDQPNFAVASSDPSGVYLYNFDSSVLDYGSHTTKSKSATSTEISPYSASVAFTVGDKNVAYVGQSCKIRGDLNNDCHVNLVDFSIMAYWYKRPNPPASVDLNGDSKIDLVDFSILAFNWTG